MAKISHHGSCRSKCSTGLKCICFEKSNWWNGKCWTRQCKTDEIRQSLYWSGNKTTMQKSPEDNQATGLFTCESFTAQNPKSIKICHKMWGTGYNGRRWNQKKNFSHRESLLSKEYPYVSLYVLTIKGQNIPKKIKIGYLKKETRPYIPNPQRCFQCQKFVHTKKSCKGKAVCAGCGEEGHNLDDCQNEPIPNISFYTPVWKTDVSCYGNVRPSLRPSVLPSFPDFFSICFEISISNLVYTFSRWHDMSRLSFIIIGSLWPSL